MAEIEGEQCVISHDREFCYGDKSIALGTVIPLPLGRTDEVIE